MERFSTDEQYERSRGKSVLILIAPLALFIFTGGCDYLLNSETVLEKQAELRLAVIPPFRMTSEIQEVPGEYSWDNFQDLGVASYPSLLDWRGRMKLCAFLASKDDVLRTQCTESVRANDDDLVGGEYFSNLLGRDPVPFLSDWVPLSNWSMTLILNDRLNYVAPDPKQLAEALQAMESLENGERIVGFYARITAFEGKEYTTGAKPLGVVIQPLR